MYPTPALSRALSPDPSLLSRIWQFLNNLTADDLMGEKRVYGGGLYKLEPKELARVPLPQFLALLPLSCSVCKQQDLFAAAE
jgi:hypothetical protein